MASNQRGILELKRIISSYGKETVNNYVDFIKENCSEIILKEIKDTLIRNEGVELRNFGTFRVNIQKASIRRNPKTGEKVNVPKKRTIKWKMSKDLFKKLNDEKE